MNKICRLLLAGFVLALSPFFVVLAYVTCNVYVAAENEGADSVSFWQAITIVATLVEDIGGWKE